MSTGQSKEASKSDRRLNGRLYELVVFEGIMEEEDAKDPLLAVWVVSDIFFIRTLRRITWTDIFRWVGSTIN